MAFKKGVHNYLKKYQFKNVTISDFLDEMELATGQEMAGYREKWLDSKEFPWQEVKELLKDESASIALVFQMEDKFQKIKSDDLDYDRYWDKSKSIYFREYLIKEYHRILSSSVIDKAFASNNVQIRRALSSSLYGISSPRQTPEKLQNQFETLIYDKSYITIENALIKLWSTFPKKRNSYLSKTKELVGLPNKNVRLLWLTLALVTEDFEPSEKEVYYKELNSYTSPNENFEVRLLAFEYLSQIQALSDDALVNLIEASEHYIWQFKKFSRNLIKELAKNTEYKYRFENISKYLNTKELEDLNKLLYQ